MGSPSFQNTTSSQPADLLRHAYPDEDGRLVSLPTKVELQSNCQPIDVFVATIPLKSASTILKYILFKASTTRLKYGAGSPKLPFKIPPLRTYSTWEGLLSQNICPRIWGALERSHFLSILSLSRQTRWICLGITMRMYTLTTRAPQSQQSMALLKLRNSLSCITLSVQHLQQPSKIFTQFSRQ